MAEVRRLSQVKPTVHTRLHIDFNWWSQYDNDWRVYLQGFLCPEHQKMFTDFQTSDLVDSIDPLTAEVQRVDGLQHILITHCSRSSGFITERTSVVDAIFKIFLATGNEPQSVLELAEKVNRPPDMILRTMTGGQVYRGIRPILDR